MPLDIDTQFAQRISSLEINLLDPVIDPTSLAAFNTQWTSFAADFQEALDAEVLSMSTISMSHALADKISTVMQAFNDLHIFSETMISSLTSTITRSDIHDFQSSSSSSPHNGPLSPSYIEPSYRWLLEHIHDPYPPTRVRDSIATETGSPRKDIDSWFIDARKRIGWNVLRKTRFSNKRHDIIDAATRFFIEDDPKRPLDPNLELEFAAIETRAKALYSEKYSESDLVTKLDMVVKDMTLEMKVLAKEEERRRSLLQMDESIERRSRPISSYPSPDRSPNRSLEPDLPSLISHCDEALPVLNGPTSDRKRQNSCSDLSDHSMNRPNKRFRCDECSLPFLQILTEYILLGLTCRLPPSLGCLHPLHRSMKTL